jgi:hypothetical protein
LTRGIGKFHVSIEVWKTTRYIHGPKFFAVGDLC